MTTDESLAMSFAIEDLPDGTMASRLNWLRAGVLGANDGIVSTAGLLVGVAGATTSSSALLIAGVAGLVAGALSMGAGEYVSVSTQRDSEEALLARERHELATMPQEELAELAALYRRKGLSPGLAWAVAEELTAHDAFKAHAEAEHGIDPHELTSPLHAAWASMVAFTLGSLLPLLAMVMFPETQRVVATAVAALAALTLTGLASATLGFSSRRRAVARNVMGGLSAMAIAYAVGSLLGHAVGL